MSFLFLGFWVVLRFLIPSDLGVQELLPQKYPGIPLPSKLLFYELCSLQIAIAEKALKTELETAKLNLQNDIDSKASKVDLQNLKVRCPIITVYILGQLALSYSLALVHLLPSWLLCTNQMYGAFCFPQMANSPISTNSA